ncbi:hypothetical protein JGI1_00244 [Candidatus Thermokryptus mobilis]|uniref:Uncharacterized protein n=1 Tax=Candidatus Thermokryptus mobilis TaxID=1643428 RepID=A0A0S4MVF4_9BACT|nr:hypothetical protein [Candidatus Thermokryptus mobilis]CUU01405.1 hypothetical protein JGI1_00244 [Candidatus Thermokryptus mobilis]
MIDSNEIKKIEETLEDVILGKFNVPKIELLYEGKDLVEIFVQKLINLNFQPKKVNEVNVEIGFRVPAFYIKDKTAYFGWVFWEIFTETKKRKLFGSAIKNQRGDWEIEITDKSDEVIFVNESKSIEIDLSTMAW